MTYRVLEVDAATGNQVEREMTASEVSEYEDHLAQRAEMDKELESKQAALDSAISKLTALGLTEEEAQAVFGS